MSFSSNFYNSMKAKGRKTSSIYNESRSVWGNGIEKAHTLNEEKEIMISISGKDYPAKDVSDVNQEDASVIFTVKGKKITHKHDNVEDAKEHAENAQEMVNKAQGKPYDAKDGGPEEDEAMESYTHEALKDQAYEEARKLFYEKIRSMSKPDRDQFVLGVVESMEVNFMGSFRRALKKLGY